MVALSLNLILNLLSGAHLNGGVFLRSTQRSSSSDAISLFTLRGGEPFLTARIHRAHHPDLPPAWAEGLQLTAQTKPHSCRSFEEKESGN
jgi:hypothetical protein